MPFIQIEGFDGYWISKQGEVFSDRSGRTLLGWINTNGYRRVTIKKDTKWVTVYVHQLVARAFLPADPDRFHVNHKNGNRLNNSVENLEWCTVAENNAHSYRELGRRAYTQGRTGARAVRSLAVEALDITTGRVVKRFDTGREAGKYFGVSPSCICAAISGIKQKTSAGHKWRFAK